MFETNIDIWRHLYGLATFVMGVAIVARASAYPSSSFRNRLLALGAFGLLHGIATWFPLLGFSAEGGAGQYRDVLYASSYIALFYFALGWNARRPMLVHYIALTSICIMTLASFVSADPEFVQGVRRFGSGLPASICAGLVFLRDEKFRFEFRFSEAVRWMVAIGFLGFAALQFFTAQDVLILGPISIPILVARAATVLVIMLGTLTLLNRFDAVARMQDKAAFAAVDQKLAKAMDISKLGSWEQDLLTGEVSWSSYMFTILGLNPNASHARYSAFLERVHPDDREAVHRARAYTLANSASCKLRYRIVRDDNSVRYIQEEAEVTTGKTGGARTLLGVLLDVTELTEARIRAEKASMAKSNFLANLSHELRTPLNAILGFSELLQYGIKKENHEEYGRYINESGRHLLSLINDILDLSKISAGKWTLDETLVDFRSVALSCAELMESNAVAAQLALTADVPDNLPLISADKRAIRQILLNLLSNAVKFTPATGRVSIFAQLTENGEFSFGVSDSGVGIAEDEQEKVFEQFAQAERDPLRAEKGTGLGLPIVKGLAVAHRGRVTLQSEVGVGTRVTIFLPSERIQSRGDGRLISAA